MSSAVRDASWSRDTAARRYIILGYLPWLPGLNLAWEMAHLPLYTIWQESSVGYKAFAVAHCTVGDLLIGAASLLLTLTIGREGPLLSWRWRRIAFGTAFFGTGYTVFSEWLNVAVLQSWAYSAIMPVISLAGLQLGLSPLLQWASIPPLALYLGVRKPIASQR
jgi:hypothetical protein